MMPAIFTFDRKGMFPILEVTGISSNIPGMDRALLSVSVYIIEKVKEFYGRVMEIRDNEQGPKASKGNIIVSFSIIFKNMEDLNQALESLRKEFG